MVKLIFHLLPWYEYIDFANIKEAACLPGVNVACYVAA